MKTHILNTRRWSIFVAMLFASGFFVSACSFDTALSGLECDEEAATRPGEVCRDGFWRIDENADVQGEDGSDNPDLDVVSDANPMPDIDETPDTADVDETPDTADIDETPDTHTCGVSEILCNGVCVTATSCSETCNPGDEQPCYGGPSGSDGVGRCSAGVLECEGGVWGTECVGEVTPSDEICNGMDDDCNGVLDDNVPGAGASCQADGDGICGSGTMQCVDDGLECVGASAESDEICDDGSGNGTGNGLDDDCNGRVDDGCAACAEGDTKSCYTGSSGTQNIGICQAGQSTCNASGEWGPCVGEVKPESESCNGADDNCNGSVDEGDPGGGASCDTSSLGVCRPGVKTCEGGAIICVANTAPSAEQCDDTDHDCDGDNTNGFDVGASCGVGVCAGLGAKICTQNADATECEVNGADIPVYYRDVDGDGYGDPDHSVQQCVLPTDHNYVDNSGDCDDDDVDTYPGAPEICDGKINDCDLRGDPNTEADQGGGLCDGSEVCQDGGCCNPNDEGNNRCLDVLCDDTDSDCASGYCESIEGPENDVCFPGHCGNGVQDADETGEDCGGASCRKCNGDVCENWYECKSDECRNIIGDWTRDHKCVDD